MWPNSQVLSSKTLKKGEGALFLCHLQIPASIFSHSPIITSLYWITSIKPSKKPLGSNEFLAPLGACYVIVHLVWTHPHHSCHWNWWKTMQEIQLRNWQQLTQLCNLCNSHLSTLKAIADRQASSSHHQIVIWICFWFYIQYQEKKWKYWDGNAV